MLEEQDMGRIADIRKNIVRMAHYSHASHVGAALSVVEILWAAYESSNITAENLSDINRDKVILSKGHASAAEYAVLAARGLLDPKLLDEYYIYGGALPGHLDISSSPAIDAAAGALGHGLPVGLGMAMANRSRKVTVVCGDGEMNEGSNWEAVMLASQRKVDNLALIVDANGLQAMGFTRDILDNSNLGARLEAFGMDVSEVDGHDLAALANALAKPSETAKAIIARTVKGKGVGFMENSLKWHYSSPDDGELARAVEEIDNA
jgi:transketolase